MAAEGNHPQPPQQPGFSGWLARAAPVALHALRHPGATHAAAGLGGCVVAWCYVGICRRRRKRLQPPPDPPGPAVCPRCAVGEAAASDLVNDTVEEIWPRIRSFLPRLLNRLLQGSLQTMNIEGLGVATFGTVDIGERKPRFGPLVVRRLPPPDPRESASFSAYEQDWCGGLEARVDFHYNSDLSVELSVLGVGSVGIRNLSVHGTLTVFLRPVLDRPPFFGAVEITCPNLPEIDYAFTGGLGKGLAQTPLVDEMLRERISQAIAAQIVTPHRLAVPLCSGLDLARATMPPPIGVLRLTLVRARNLPQRRTRLPWRSVQPTPFVCAAVGGTRIRFAPARGIAGGDPQWDDGAATSDFMVFSIEQQVLLDVLDEDMLALPRGCRPVGRAYLADEGHPMRVPTVYDFRQDGSRQLHVVGEGGEGRGTLCVQADWLNVEPITVHADAAPLQLPALCRSPAPMLASPGTHPADGRGSRPSSHLMAAEINCAEIHESLRRHAPFSVCVKVRNGEPGHLSTHPGFADLFSRIDEPGSSLVEEVLLEAASLGLPLKRLQGLEQERLLAFYADQVGMRCNVDPLLVAELLAPDCDYRPGARHAMTQRDPKQLVEPGPGIVLRPTPVQEHFHRTSAVCHVLYRGAEVEVCEIFGERARLDFPVAGWVSVVSAAGGSDQPHIVRIDHRDLRRAEKLNDWQQRALRSRQTRLSGALPQWRQTLHFVTTATCPIRCELRDSSGTVVAEALTEISEGSPVACGPFEFYRVHQEDEPCTPTAHGSSPVVQNGVPNGRPSAAAAAGGSPRRDPGGAQSGRGTGRGAVHAAAPASGAAPRPSVVRRGGRQRAGLLHASFTLSRLQDQFADCMESLAGSRASSFRSLAMGTPATHRPAAAGLPPIAEFLPDVEHHGAAAAAGRPPSPRRRAAIAAPIFESTQSVQTALSLLQSMPAAAQQQRQHSSQFSRVSYSPDRMAQSESGVVAVVSEAPPTPGSTALSSAEYIARRPTFSGLPRDATQGVLGVSSGMLQRLHTRPSDTPR